MWRYSVLLFLLLIVRYTKGQEYKITGIIHNEKGESLEGSSIVLYENGQKTVSYTVSETTGSFSLSFDAKSKSFPLSITVSHIGYRNYVKKISLGEVNVHLRIDMIFDETMLNEIAIKKIVPIIKRQDTTSYRVESFAKEEDRSIGDVLKRLPGISIDKDGAIYHNDKKIQNLYIQGDDLMSGRYGLATKAIRKEMIESVNVIDHHQPVKVLEKKILTDNVAIDLILKDDKSWKKTFQTRAGLGIPALYDAEITGVLLNKTFKAINLAGANNISENYATSLNQLGTSGYGESLKEQTVDIAVGLGLQVPDPLVAKNYYHNNSKMFHLNDIARLKNGTTVKLNAQYLRDKYLQIQSSSIDNFVENDTIRYEERFQGIDRSSLFSITANLQNNGIKAFLNNTFSFNTEKKNNSVNTLFNLQEFDQRLKNSNINFSNDFNWIPQISQKGILELRSFISYNNLYKDLSIGPKFSPNFLYNKDISDTGNYLQDVSIPRFYTDNFISYKLYSDNFSQDYKLGATVDYIKLESQLSNGTTLVDGFQNDATWTKKTIYFTPSFQYKKGKMRFISNIPFIYQHINFNQGNFGNNDFYKNFFVLPNLNLQYDINGENSIGLHYILRNNSSNIQNLFSGKILQNFRSYLFNNTGFDLRNTHRIDLVMKNEKPIKMMFSSINFSYSLSKFNSILEKQVNESGESYALTPYNNSQHRYSIKGTYSKYFYHYGLTTTFTAGLNYTKSNMLINNQSIAVKTMNPHFSIAGIKRFGDRIELRYTPSVVYTQRDLIQAADDKRNKQFTWKHDVSGWIKFSDFFQSKMDFNYVSYNQSSQQTNRFYLFDLTNTLPLKISKSRLDVNFSCLNLFDVKKYAFYHIDENINSVQNFQLRGRMFTIEANIYF